MGRRRTPIARWSIHQSGSQDRKSTRLNSSHTVIYTLSLHDALPIFRRSKLDWVIVRHVILTDGPKTDAYRALVDPSVRITRSEEHTSELQSHSDLHSFPTRRSSDLPPEQARLGDRASCDPD